MTRISVSLLSAFLAIFFTGCTSPEPMDGTTDDGPDAYDLALEDHLVHFEALPEDAENAANPVTDEKVALGHMLYFDSRLSLTGNNSCNSCHKLATFGVDKLPTSPGDNGGFGDRNSSTTLNAALHSTQFWDGRAGDVEEQAGMPILNPVEMAIPSKDFLVERLSGIDLYHEAFAEAFPEAEVPLSYENIQNAIAAFERELITPSRVDEYLRGQHDALTEQEKKGMLIFALSGCTQCHNGALLGGNSFQKFGVYGDYWDHTGSEHIDEGRFTVTGNESEKYLFKVPSLRNIAETEPYFHDGSVDDLEESIRIMARIQLDKDLTDEQVANMVAFLEALTGEVPDEFQTAPDVIAGSAL